MSLKILIMAGGTGGHIFPGLAVAEQLVDEGWEVCWLGTRERMEARLVPEYGYKLRFIDVVGVRGNGLLRLLFAPFMIARSIFQAIRIIREEKPTVVLGMGGFASGPGGIAAWLMSKPMVLHEQNAIPGMTNRILARFSKWVLMAFPNTFKGGRKVVLVGNPIRRDIAALSAGEPHKIASDGPVRVLVLGGSLGAKALNENLPELFKQAGELAIWHQTGKGNKAAVEGYYRELNEKGHDIRVDEFIKDMTGAYRWADLVICRAGALTVAEVAAAGKGAVFVPFPFAVDDHQTQNARWLADNGAALVMPQSELMNEQSIARICALIGDKDKLQQMAMMARKVAITDAAEKVASYCKTVAGPYGRR